MVARTSPQPVGQIRGRFPIGNLCFTPGVAELARRIGVEPVVECLMRHAVGDWGEVCRDDRQANEQALVDGDRLLSAYRVGEPPARIWIITEADRSVTTILLPDEY